MESLKYPIGRFEYPTTYTLADIDRWISEIEEVPTMYREVVSSMTEAQLNETYRSEGWTARQVIHHVPDSHMQAYARFKFVLTEDRPLIKPYSESLWAALPDSTETPVEISLNLLEALHQRWVFLIKGMREEQFKQVYIHPQYGKEYELGAVCKLYAWHGKHHLSHLQLIVNH
ncbi:UNVERIFIED_CONTAM: hypothetical protein GTU68_015064 [Idotea baltica]|nr:hypothetical protein [Idotea baltica]